MKLPFADAEERGNITDRVAGEALGPQPWLAECDAQRRVVGAQ